MDVKCGNPYPTERISPSSVTFLPPNSVAYGRILWHSMKLRGLQKIVGLCMCVQTFEQNG